MSKSRAIHVSGWLSPPFTQGQTFSSDDLTIFKCFRVIFSLKNKTIQFPLSFNLYLKKKKQPQSCQFATYWQNALFEFLTSQTGEMAFPIFKVIIR